MIEYFTNDGWIVKEQTKNQIILLHKAGFLLVITKDVIGFKNILEQPVDYIPYLEVKDYEQVINLSKTMV